MSTLAPSLPVSRSVGTSHSAMRQKIHFVVFCLAALCGHSRVLAQAASDGCTNAAANQYTVTASCATFVTFSKPAAFVADYNPGTCNAGTLGDAFGWFTATATQTTITYDPVAGDPILHVLTGACGGPYTQVGCADAGGNGVNETVTIPTVIGNVYRIRIQRLGASTVLNGAISICSPPPPANDDPCAATPLTVGTTCTFSAGTTFGATPTTTPTIPAPGCSSYTGGDVWFSAVVPATGRLILDANTGVVLDGGMALYTATNCSAGFVLVECDDDDSVNGAMPFIDRSGLTPGSTVYIRFWEFGNDNNGTFSICAYAPAPPPPACGSTVYDPGGSAANYANGANFTATYCPATAGDVVTINFTSFVTEGGLDVVTIYNGPTTASPVFGTFSGTTNPGSITSTAVGGCLTLTFTSDASITYAGWAANITCGTPPPPVNACGTTVYDTGGSGGNYPNNQNYVVTYCPVSPTHVVTLNFTAFNTEAGLDLVTLYNGSTINDPVIATLSGNGIPGSFSGTVPGACVTLQFTTDGSVTFAGWAASVTCAVPPPPPAGDCLYVLTMADDFGDGWGSSYVTVDINGVATNYTVTGSSRNVVIGVFLGQTVTLSYNNSGTFQGENSYSLSLQGNGAYFNSGSPPAAGIVYLASVDCVPPPTQPQDCNGGFTVCGGQAFNNSSNNTGNVVDLNAGNSGCLSSGERQGTWYYFSPSTSGNVGFTISPTVTTDYDFAVWGPMGTVTCPPPGPPLRCSYAAPTGDTGVGNGATDPTEGAGGDRWVSLIPVTAGQVYLLYVDNFTTNGQSFTMSWQLSGGASLDCALLPVEFVNLEAIAGDGKVDLSWNTLSERNSDHFILERSTDAINFAPIGTLPALGNSSHTVDYLFTDGNPANGANYYRVIMVDVDGSSLRSPVVSATLLTSGEDPILAPNPAGELLYMTLRPDMPDVLELRVMDAAGRLVRSIQVRLPEGSNRAELPLHGLDQGAYSLAIHGSDGTAVGYARFVKE